MLPPENRLRTSEDFRRTVRGGRRAGTRILVVHLDQSGRDSVAPVRVGLVVSRAIGNAVTRNRVKRRLRHLAAARLGELPAGSVLVIRALPGAGWASSRDLVAALDRGLERAQDRAPDRMRPRAAEGSPV